MKPIDDPLPFDFILRPARFGHGETDSRRHSIAGEDDGRSVTESAQGIFFIVAGDSVAANVFEALLQLPLVGDRIRGKTCHTVTLNQPSPGFGRLKGRNGLAHGTGMGRQDPPYNIRHAHQVRAVDHLNHLDMIAYQRRQADGFAKLHVEHAHGLRGRRAQLLDRVCLKGLRLGADSAVVSLLIANNMTEGLQSMQEPESGTLSQLQAERQIVEAERILGTAHQIQQLECLADSP